MRRILVALSLTTSLAGCAGMDANTCRGTDWYSLGERDALVYGLRPQIDVYAHQCTRHGVQPAEKEYLAGWFDGDRERAVRMSGSECCAPSN
jgi:hypothetical protein